MSTVVLSTLTILAICGVVLSRVEDFPGKRGGTLRVAVIGHLGDLDPARLRTAFAVSLLRATARTPYAYEPGRGLVSDLALGPPEISNDSTELKITLRKGVRFAPPVDREITSDDIAYAIERGFLPGVDSATARLYFEEIDGVEEFRNGDADSISGLETPDAHTLVINLDESTARTVAGALTLPIAAPVPREYATKYDEQDPSTYGRHLVATGPYEFQPGPDGLIPGPLSRRLSLERNPSWEAGTDFRPAFVDRIELEPQPTHEIAAEEVLHGNDSISGDFAAPSEVTRDAKIRDPDQVVFTATGVIRYLSLNTNLAPLDNVDVRRAISAAFDRIQAREFFGGPEAGGIATHWIPPGVPGFEDAGGAAGFGFDFLASPEGNLELAHSYMRTAGYASGSYRGPARLVAVGTDDQEFHELGRLTRRTFAELGLPLRLRFVDADRALERCSDARRTPAVCFDARWVKDFDDAQTVLSPLFSGEEIRPVSNDNWSLLAEPAVDDAIREGATTTGAQDRAEGWADADRAITELAPAVPLLWDRYPLLDSADVRGVVDRELGHWDLSFTSLR